MAELRLWDDAGAVDSTCAKCGVAIRVKPFALAALASWNNTHDDKIRTEHMALCDDCTKQWQIWRADVQSQESMRAAQAWRRYKEEVRELARNFSPREAIERATRNVSAEVIASEEFANLKARWDSYFCGSAGGGNRKKGGSF